MKKILIICGPTATGKTSLGVHLAKKFNGEIVSADSRQVYKGLDIITGKDIPSAAKFENRNKKLGIYNPKLSIGFRTKEEIPIWLVDIVELEYVFNVGEYKQVAQKVIKDIWSRKKLPIVVGGTGLYIRALQEPLRMIDIPPDERLRKQLERLNVTKLADKLKSMDPTKWKRMNNSDRQNPRRLIRAIETSSFMKNHPDTDLTKEEDDEWANISQAVYMIGLMTKKEKLDENIIKRVEKRIEDGAEKEVENTLTHVANQNVPSMSSTGVKELRKYRLGFLTKEEAIQKWKQEELQYARRQMTWFKKEKEINWFDLAAPNFITKIEAEVTKWYTR